ncbi:MAG TPA: hypothetical protein PKC43_03265 [Phycisphaerales bacterium]|nr:hypothetical protein [Phycisphaerales bacterium]HMP36448.1 hypothetical protein [Phycisphaerales bacterium]
MSAPAPGEAILVDPSVDRLLAALAEPALRDADTAPLLGASVGEWRSRSAAELDLASPSAGAARRGGAGAARGGTAHDTAIRSRQPIIATGHQARFWHPGIVVKSLLADLLAERCGGLAVHVIVEQETDSPLAFDVPVRRRGGGLDRAAIDARPTPSEVVVARLPAFDPASLDAQGTRGAGLRSLLPLAVEPASRSIDDGLVAMTEALRRRRDERSLGRQVTLAAFDLLRPCCRPPAVIGAGDLLRTSFGRALLRRLAEDPEASAVAYNDAVAETPGSAAPLAILDDRIELPLWRIDGEGRRVRAWDDDLARAHEASGPSTASGADDGAIVLLPRALLMTALLRLGLCDLFIHGTGGIVYDAAMERWIARWLGASTAPAALASATRLLSLPGAPDPPHRSAAELARMLRMAEADPESIERDGAELIALRIQPPAPGSAALDPSGAESSAIGAPGATSVGAGSPGARPLALDAPRAGSDAETSSAPEPAGALASGASADPDVGSDAASSNSPDDDAAIRSAPRRAAGPGPTKRGFLEQLEALPRRSPARAQAWRAMHRRIESLLAQHRDAIDRIRAALGAAQEWERLRPILEDRTWPFPFHEADTLAGLREELRRSLERRA